MDPAPGADDQRLRRPLDALEDELGAEIDASIPSSEALEPPQPPPPPPPPPPMPSLSPPHGWRFGLRRFLARRSPTSSSQVSRFF